jgi:hypothetical protein
VDIFLNRVKEYEPAGRLQTEEEANQIDKDLGNLLWDNGIVCNCLDADDEAAKTIAFQIHNMIKEKGKENE